MSSLLALAALAFVLFLVYLHATQSATLSPSHDAGYLHPSTASLQSSYSVRPSESVAQFGWLSFIAWPLYQALRFLFQHGTGNWGWAIVVLTVIFNLLTLWPRIAAIKSSVRTMRLQPRVEAIKQRYAHLKANDPGRASMNSEMLALYKAEGAGMFGGLLPLLLQMPLFIAYFRVLRGAPELHQAHWGWIADLSQPDPLHILPLVILASMLLTQFATPSPGMNRTQRRMLAIAMPVAMGVTLWHCAAGLALYWATGSVIGLLFQLMVNRSATGREMRALASRRAIP